MSCQLLNEILADSMILYSLYEKHHWLVRGHTFSPLHLPLDKHAEGQLEAGDQLELRGPIGGYFVWEPAHSRPPSLAGGGVGVAPLMAMLRHHAAAYA